MKERENGGFENVKMGGDEWRTQKLEFIMENKIGKVFLGKFIGVRIIKKNFQMDLFCNGELRWKIDLIRERLTATVKINIQRLR